MLTIEQLFGNAIIIDHLELVRNHASTNGISLFAETAAVKFLQRLTGAAGNNGNAFVLQWSGQSSGLRGGGFLECHLTFLYMTLLEVVLAVLPVWSFTDHLSE